MNEERRNDRMIDKMLRLWPIAAVIVAGAAGYVKMQIDVSNVAKCPEQITLLKERVLVLETQFAIMKERRDARNANGK